MAAEQRRQILQLMGIDVWVHRRAVDVEAVSEQPSEAAPQSASALTAELKRDLQQTGSPTVEANPIPAAVSAKEQVQRAVSSAFPACQILAVRQSDVLVLADMSQQTLARRLGRDLVASSTREWRKRPTETLFDWQPEQISGASVDGRRALAAFVDRQLDELGAGSLVIADALVVERLPELADLTMGRNARLTPVASLQQLATDVGAKRALWTQLQQLLA